MSEQSSTERFSDRVQDYVRYRPGYPVEILDHLQRITGIGAAATVADIGSGTGIFTRLLAQRFRTVYAVEPNAAMRAAGEASYRKTPAVVSVTGIAEHTGLPGGSADLVTCAQAFHWFRPGEARAEFLRILRRPAWVALIWNSRYGAGSTDAAAGEAPSSPAARGTGAGTAATATANAGDTGRSAARRDASQSRRNAPSHPSDAAGRNGRESGRSDDGASPEGAAFSVAYEMLLRTHCPEYEHVGHRDADVAAIARFFAPPANPSAAADSEAPDEQGSRAGEAASEAGLPFEVVRLPYHQDLDWDAFRGRVFSSSYVPHAYGEPGHPFGRKLREVFERHQRDGNVRLNYTTELFVASLT